MTFYGDLAGLGFGKGAALRTVDARPGSYVDLGPQGTFQFFVRLIRANDVGVAHKEAFAGVVGINEPAGDIVGGGIADFSGRWVVYVEALDLDFITPIGLGQRMVSDIFIPSQYLS
jgi:hypothetical protein